jgi:hypothetical protein
MTMTPIDAPLKGAPQNAENQNAAKLLVIQNGDRHIP